VEESSLTEGEEAKDTKLEGDSKAMSEMSLANTEPKTRDRDLSPPIGENATLEKYWVQMDESSLASTELTDPSKDLSKTFVKDQEPGAQDKEPSPLLGANIAEDNWVVLDGEPHTKTPLEAETATPSGDGQRPVSDKEEEEPSEDESEDEERGGKKKKDKKKKGKKGKKKKGKKRR
jgi:hypothetical protein